MTPDAHRARAARCRLDGDEKKAQLFDFATRQAELLAWRKKDRERMSHLGRNYYTAVNAAHFMAAALSSKRMPPRAFRWQAQHALIDWLPHLPEAERDEVLAVLKRCTVNQLGRKLAVMVAAGDSRPA